MGDGIIDGTVAGPQEGGSDFKFLRRKKSLKNNSNIFKIGSFPPVLRYYKDYRKIVPRKRWRFHGLTYYALCVTSVPTLSIHLIEV